MFKHQKDVQNFMYKFSQNFREKPEIPTDNELKLACKLILSEAFEFVHACGITVVGMNLENKKDPKFDFELTNIPELVEMVDALGDIQYVNDWAANCIGVDLEPIANEIQRSNMSKMWPYCVLCNKGNLVTQDGRTWVHEDSNSEQHTVTLGWRVVKDEHGKILKPPSYSPADIKKELEYQRAKF